jgi:hypothetical protein
MLAGVSFAQPAAAGPHFTTIDPPGSTATVCAAINDAGTIAGYYVDGKDRVHGFARTAGGTITSFDPPQSKYTEALAIDRAGAITGFFEHSGEIHGTKGYAFIRHTDATITVFDPANDHLRPAGIDNAKTVAGNNGEHGFVRAKGSGFERFDPPNSVGTLVTGINNSGTVTGSFATYQVGDLVNLGFLRAPDGTITSFAAPEAHNTWPSAINDGGSLTGEYEDQSGVVHGFVRAADGTVANFDAPGADGTGGLGINRKGTIVGQYWERDNNSYHGFIRAKDDAIKTFDVPGSSKYTSAQGINDKGMITGSYQDAERVYHGFLRTP